MRAGSGKVSSGGLKRIKTRVRSGHPRAGGRGRVHRSGISGGGPACPQAGDESRPLVPAILESTQKKQQPPPPGITVHEGDASVKSRTKDPRGTATWHRASGTVAAETQCLPWESGGAEKAFSGPTKEQGRCPGRERSTRKGREAERTWGRREAAYG